MTLLELTEPLFQYMCRLNRLGRRGASGKAAPDTSFVALSATKAPTGAPAKAPPAAKSASLDYAVARAEIKALFEDMMSKAATDMRLSQQARKIELPLLFFVDSMI